VSDIVPNPPALAEVLAELSQQGIRADRHNVKRDMCAQFSDPHEWIREVVVNAYDACASLCRISGSQDAGKITIVIEDDGHGMDRQGVIVYSTLFRSVKHADSVSAIGTHGIGKLSVAAIPGQCGFLMVTSTGKECWRMTAGNLCSDDPIHLEQVEPVPPHGTRFEITFETDVPLHEALAKLREVLERYVQYLPIDIVIHDRDAAPGHPKLIRLYRASWAPRPDAFGRAYTFRTAGLECSVAIEVGPAFHEVYQNRVFVSGRYNLISHDLENKIEIPHLGIRIDSPDFALPFGRHCLRDESVLTPVARHLRTHIIPQYVDELCAGILEDEASTYDISLLHAEEIAVSLMAFHIDWPRASSRLPVFAALNRERLSLRDVRAIVETLGVIYLGAEDSVGADYQAFPAPVLSAHQPAGARRLLETFVGDRLVNLGAQDTVLEAPPGAGPQLGPREKRFERLLGFHPEVMGHHRYRPEDKGAQPGLVGFKIDREETERLTGVSKEYHQAREDLGSIKWRVNYLVERDGRTPCRTHKFLFKNDTVVLNLNHPEIRKLVGLSETAPHLAGHWALALCLEENTRMLKHLTPEAREDLLTIDCLAKCGAKDGADDADSDENRGDDNKVLREFMRNLQSDASWLN